MRRAVGLVAGLVRLVLVLLILALLALLVMGAITTQRGWSQTTGTLTVRALHRPVTVGRDRSGIIQITADDRHDLFVAQGYVHAQERMWQMEISRRIGAGRLSELFGKSQIDTDTYIRTLGWRVAAERDLAAMSSDSIAILQAYADGVNAWTFCQVAVSSVVQCSNVYPPTPPRPDFSPANTKAVDRLPLCSSIQALTPSA